MRAQYVRIPKLVRGRTEAVKAWLKACDRIKNTPDESFTDPIPVGPDQSSRKTAFHIKTIA